MTATTTATAIPAQAATIQTAPIAQLAQPNRSARADALEKTRVEALFVSHLQRSECVTPESIRSAVTTTVRRHGCTGCAALVAQEFGEHPETAIGRMRWARTAVQQAYALG